MRLSLATFAFIALATAFVIAPHGVVAENTCKLVATGTATVAEVRDGRTLLLTDGRELRLAAIEADDSGRAALRSLVDGRIIRLENLGMDQDRYGRVVAFIYANDTGSSVQEAMVFSGKARVSARIGDKACADMLLAAERAARAARRGLWADPNFAPLRSDNITRIEAARGRFALIEGKVLSVRESGATIYLNFGRRWTQDFTVTIPKRYRRQFSAAGIDPKLLERRSIRVRGWIEQRSGPVIEAEAPEQIELVE